MHHFVTSLLCYCYLMVNYDKIVTCTSKFVYYLSMAAMFLRAINSRAGIVDYVTCLKSEPLPLVVQVNLTILQV